MDENVLVLLIFYGGLSLLVVSRLVYGLWEWRRWKDERMLTDKVGLL